jgi:hypothetical protein
LREPGRTPTHQNCKILKTDDFYRKKLWLFNRCSEVAESFSDTFDQNRRAEVHQDSGQGLQNALSYRANGNCVKRICELPVNN